MNLRDIVSPASVEVGSTYTDKTAVIDRLVELAANTGKISDMQEAKNEVWERESIMSTGVGGGIALPHAKTNAVKEPVGSVIVLKEGLDFDSLDNEDVDILFLLLGRESNVGLHLRLLSKISRLLSGNEFQNELKTAKDPNEVMDLFAQFDSATTI
jgi:fructose-specific phosphotransferase system IIA component